MIHSQGRKRSLLIQKCTYEDQGLYLCKTTDDNTSAKLTVRGRQEPLLFNFSVASVSRSRRTLSVFLFGFSTARDIRIIKKLQDLEVTEKESAAFVCEVSHDEVDGQWFKGDVKLKAGDSIKMRQEGECSSNPLLFIYRFINR